MNEEQKVLLRKIMKMRRGTILRKGKEERVLWSIMPGMIFYKTKRSKVEVTGLNIRDFLKWAEKAEIVDS